ncbi:hypothetical protein AGLY_001325 [Aphis glycines]|uniref:Uncharacterized protein n=1 Tax=Aphis glycines TaxID=307491 RepID=A0A6G0UBR9_APHGL|nr:hypothetical protein AGLY_001325 [Aphis glycines]
MYIHLSLKFSFRDTHHNDIISAAHTTPFRRKTENVVFCAGYTHYSTACNYMDIFLKISDYLIKKRENNIFNLEFRYKPKTIRLKYNINMSTKWCKLKLVRRSIHPSPIQKKSRGVISVKYSWCIIKVKYKKLKNREKPHKSDGKTGIFTCLKFSIFPIVSFNAVSLIIDELLYTFTKIKCALQYASTLFKYFLSEAFSVLIYKLNSERSEECIGFTMIITSRNNAPISNYGGGFRCKSEYPWCIIKFSKKSRKTNKKNDGKTAIFTQNQFSTKSIFFMVCRKKFLDDQKVLKIYYKVSYELSNFYEICQKRENLQRNDNDLSQTILNICYFSKSISHRYLKILPAQFFLLAFEVQILTKIRQNYEYLQIILPLKHKPPFSPTTGNYILG